MIGTVAALALALIKPLPADEDADAVVVIEDAPAASKARASTRRRRQLERKLRASEAEGDRRAVEAEAAVRAQREAEARAQAAAAALDHERSALSELQERHAAARKQARREAERLRRLGDPAGAARTLASFGRAFEDPALLLDAASLRGDDEEPKARAEAWTYTHEAEAMLDRPAVQENLGPASIAALRERHAVLTASLSTRPDAPRRAILPLALGSSAAAVGIAGLSMLGGGVYLERQRQDQLRTLRDAGVDPDTVDLAPLDAQGRRARTMMLVGAVSGATGVVLGGALIGVGIHRLRGSDAATNERVASLRVTPSRRGVALRGRF